MYCLLSTAPSQSVPAEFCLSCTFTVKTRSSRCCGVEVTMIELAPLTVRTFAASGGTTSLAQGTVSTTCVVPGLTVTRTGAAFCDCALNVATISAMPTVRCTKETLDIDMSLLLRLFPDRSSVHGGRGYRFFIDYYLDVPASLFPRRHLLRLLFNLGWSKQSFHQPAFCCRKTFTAANTSLRQSASR